MDFDDRSSSKKQIEPGEVKELSKATRRAVLQNIGHLTQLGFSIACPMILCTVGALKLSQRFQLGSWVVLIGVLFGMVSGISCFLTFAQSMVRRSRKNLYSETEEWEGDQ